MTIEKMNFHYPKGNIQSIYSHEEMTALELAAATSGKVDECIEMVNGVEQSAIEATQIVDNMRFQQDNFITENNDVRATMIIDNQNFLNDLEGTNTDFQTAVNLSKTNFENDMTTAVETIISNSETNIETNVNDKIDALVNDGTIDNLINTQILGDVKDDILSAGTAFAETTGVGVITGLRVQQQATPNMTVSVEAGTAHLYNGKRYNSGVSQNITIDAADLLYLRKDIIYINKDNVLSYGKGIASSVPIAPSPADALILAELLISTTTTSIRTANIEDKRIIKKDNEQIIDIIESVELDLIEQGLKITELMISVKGKNTAEIQDIINTSHLKGTIYFPNTETNIYEIDNTLFIPSNTTILFAEGVKLKMANGINKVMITNADHVGGNEYIKITNGIFDQNPANQTIYKSALLFKNLDNSIFENCNILETRFDGTYVGVGAFSMDGCSKNRIINCQVHNSGDEGIYLVNCFNNLVSGGHYGDCQNGSGVACGETGANNIFENVTSENCVGSNFSINNPYSIVKNCISLNGLGNNSITLGHTGAPASYSIVEGCFVKGNIEGEGGIRVLGGSVGCSIINNRVEDITNVIKGAIGIGVSDNGKETLIANNRIKNCVFGIYAVGNNQINNNIIELCLNSGITIMDGKTSIISNNTSKNNGKGGLGYGIYSNAGNNQITISGNSCYDDQIIKSQQRGLYTDGSNNLIVNNTFIDNKDAQLTAGPDNNISGNILSKTDKLKITSTLTTGTTTTLYNENIHSESQISFYPKSELARTRNCFISSIAGGSIIIGHIEGGSTDDIIININ